MKNTVYLPPLSSSEKILEIADTGQLTIVGANGVGKTRFLDYLVSINERPSMILSVASAFYPGGPSDSSSAIDMKYREKISKPLRDENLPQIDKLLQMLLHDEFNYLLGFKTDKLLYGKQVRLEPTKLDVLVRLWQEIFPGNQIINRAGMILFSTESGDNLINLSRLSSGEKAVLYYIAGVLYADEGALICIDNPSMFLHPSILNTLWNAIEGIRTDCTFVYNTSDVDFLNSRTGNQCIWVKSHNVHKMTWDYSIIGKDSIPEDLLINLIGSRRPILFIEGDAVHSIDAKLYPLVFKRYTVRPLGSCNKVIESTRSFNDLKSIHKLESLGLVDRDRRTEEEVAYLRRKNILVPNVAEIENIFLVEDVVRIMSRHRKRNPEAVFSKVKRTIVKMFGSHFKYQALLHVRHRMKRALEYRGDVKVTSITELESHLHSLPDLINVRKQYETLLSSFGLIHKNGDYAEILKVFNHKPMLPESQIAGLLGYKNKAEYITGVLTLLKGTSPMASELRRAMLNVFEI